MGQGPKARDQWPQGPQGPKGRGQGLVDSVTSNLDPLSHRLWDRRSPALRRLYVARSGLQRLHHTAVRWRHVHTPHTPRTAEKPEAFEVFTQMTLTRR